jgi:hypothetical protein
VIWFYLLFAILTIDGRAVPTEAVPFASWEDCNREGIIRAGEKAKQVDIKDVLWSCISVDFTPADQLFSPPVVAPLPKKDGV